MYGLKKNDIVRSIAHEYGCSIRQFAVKWLASWPTLCSFEPNILSEADLIEFAQACDGNYPNS